jgi:spore coat protein A
VRIAALALAAVGLAGPAAADSVTIEPSKDNTLYEDASGSLSNGAGTSIFVGRTGPNGGLRALRGVLEFDVAGAVPAGATVTSASLSMNLIQTTPTFFPATMGLHVADAEWGEGSSVAVSGSGAPATSGDATWIHTFYASDSWASPGGDYVATPSATQSVLALGLYTWSSAQLAADVQAFLDAPAQNHGWVLIGDEDPGGNTARRFDSREGATPALRPRLTIVFDPPAGGSGACCAADGTCSVVLDPGTSCAGSYQGSGSMCTPNPCPQPSGACCIDDAAATCSEVSELDCTDAGGTWQGAASSCAAAQCPVIPTAFVDPLPIPALATPVSGTPGGVASYAIAMREVQQTLHSELPPTTLWGYGDGPSGAVFPGPTIEATSDQTVTVDWINDLRDSSAPGSPKPLRTDHLLPVDPCPHGAEDSPKTVVHLHGAHTRAEFDGHPEDTFLPGSQATYVYENHQLPAALWYHDHALGQTRLNVYLGLAGMYIIRDATENALGLPSGEFELPLVIVDRSFEPDGSLRYPATVQEAFFGDTILVNGRVWPYHDVKQGKYRFRVLNASNSRHLTLEFCPGSQASPCPSPATFQLLGQEGGLLPAPVPLTRMTLGPAERADVVMDFAPYAAGSEVYLVNSAPAPFPGTPGAGVVPEVMKFAVQGQAGFSGAVPSSLRAMEVLDELDAVEQREFELMQGGGDACSPFVWQIVSLDGNGQPVGSRWEDVVEYPELGTTEVWSFVNLSGMTHPMHVHLDFFQVLDRQPIGGSPAPPAAEEAGWKDTVQVGPNEIVRVITRFEDYTGRFPYHCHILEHEDHEMMRQFQTVSCGNGALEPTEECDDGNGASGDGCSQACELEDGVSFYGQAQGGDVTLTVDGVLQVVPTSAGQTPGQVAADVAAAIGGGAFAAGNRVVTTGTIESVLLNDAGLSLTPLFSVPALSAPGLALLALLLAVLGLQLREAR